MNNNKNIQQEKEWLLREKYRVENESQLEGGKGEAFSADLARLKKGEPLAHVIGHMPFLNCKIDLSFKPLIPRPETEFWVNDFINSLIMEWPQVVAKQTRNNTETRTAKVFQETRLDTTRQKHNHLTSRVSILDIFSGSGCIGISILKNSEARPRCLVEVDFAEINPLFIEQIKKNISLNLKKGEKYNIYQSDVFENIPQNKKYHYILANPPYIPKNKKIDSSVKDFEDHNSLFAPDKGLYFIKKTILEGLPRLFKNGKIYLEFDENSKEEIEKFLRKEKIQKYQFKKDQFNNWRLLIVEK